MRDCVRISQLNTTGVSASVRPTPRQDFLIAENGKDNYMGGVGMAGNGTLHVVWSRSSATAGDFPSSYAAYQLPSDASELDQPEGAPQGRHGRLHRGALGRLRRRGPGSARPVCRLAGQRVFGHGAEWKTWISRLQPLGTTYVPITPVRVLDTRVGERAVGQVHIQGRPDLAGHRRRRHPRRRGRGDRQRDGHRAGAAGLRGGHPDRDQHPAVVDDQLPAR